MYHFIGIKGAGMSALAQIMHSLGMDVQGSDVEKTFFTEKGLREKNIKILPFDENNIHEGLEIVKGNAFTEENPEVKKSIELGLKVNTYQEMVGKLTREFKTISVAGCHGKTTTTAMLSHILDNIKGANYLIGDGTGHANKDNEYFVLEACEYKRHFLEYRQKYGIITNIELDHVDYFKDIEDVLLAYKSFCENVSDTVVACGDDEYNRKLNINNILYYGLDESNDIVAKNIKYNSTGTTFDVYFKGEFLGTFVIRLCGKHMLLNALAVITICYLEKIDLNQVKQHLLSFKGAKRRFSEEIIGDNVVIDDYAHHPTEVKVTIEAAKQKYPGKKIISVFQPHTYSRTKEFATDLAEVLNTCDASYIMKIHPSREKQEDFKGITSDIIISKLKNGYNISEDNADVLLKYENAVIIFMSPNDIYKLENDYKEKRRKL
ncbi:MAG: UDP-N-acetylmuramate--L-alanine ligase [Bacilli bacterium]|nr:UDP-N-acetylmuramate--L-alanine ligase [Bacilli bacterium]